MRSEAWASGQGGGVGGGEPVSQAKGPESVRPPLALALARPISPGPHPRAGFCQLDGLARGDPAARHPAGPARAAVSPQRPCAWRRGSRAAGGGRAGGRAGRLGEGTPAAPPRVPLRLAGPPPPRRAQLRQSSRLCNVSSRSGGGDASGSGRGPAVAASAARPGGRSRREPAATSLPPGRCGRLCAPRRGAWTPGQPGCGRAQRTVDTGLRGLRPESGSGTASHAASPPRLRSPAAGAGAGAGPVI